MRRGRSTRTNIPYASHVEYYKQNGNKLATQQIIYKGRGWYDVVVNGKSIGKTRKPISLTSDKVSLFRQTSYHSGRPGKISRYGTHDYNLEYTQDKKIGDYELGSPVLSEKKRSFGKVLRKAPKLESKYVALNWRPEGSTVRLYVERKRVDDKGVYHPEYRSREYSLNEKALAKKEFYDQVNKIKKDVI